MNLLLQFDTLLTSFIYHLPHNLVLDTLFYFISAVGLYGIGWIIISILLIVFEEKKHKKFMLPFFLSILLSLIISQVVLKNIFMRPRPFFSPVSTNFNQFQLISTSYPSDFSFPSGHATVAFAAAYVLIYFDKKRRVLWLSLAALVAFSRVYLGYHYVFDVLAGGIIGITISYGIMKIYASRQRK